MGKLSMDLYLNSLSKRYNAASKREKGIILAELCESSGYHKKHAIRLLNSFMARRQLKKNKGGRPPIYTAALYLEPLKRIWLMSDQTMWEKTKNGTTALVATLRRGL